MMKRIVLMRGVLNFKKMSGKREVKFAPMRNFSMWHWMEMRPIKEKILRWYQKKIKKNKKFKTQSESDSESSHSPEQTQTQQSLTQSKRIYKKKTKSNILK